ncbi:hypothetical protein OH799_11065 [Nocardia sp. NBC_00881]|uniref:hypothetical protein n=1 Tax=Nocardia sp. NBC_00881 TaxID=2975995 RepID=UPI003864E624|nr:hypothetical protein OH799_11065 [Nocardia sp. NBC_00881]
MGDLLLVFLPIVIIVGVLGVAAARRIRARRRAEDDPTTRARAAGVRLTRQVRASQWRNRPYDKTEYTGGGGGGCGGGSE